MSLMNSIDQVESEATNIYTDFEAAWAEYEYMSQIITGKIHSILEEDESNWSSSGLKDDFYHDIKILDNRVIIHVRPAVSICALKQISDLLGVDGRIVLYGTKKNAKMRIVFEKDVYTKEED